MTLFDYIIDQPTLLLVANKILQNSMCKLAVSQYMKVHEAKNGSKTRIFWKHITGNVNAITFLCLPRKKRQNIL